MNGSPAKRKYNTNVRLALSQALRATRPIVQPLTPGVEAHSAKLMAFKKRHFEAGLYFILDVLKNNCLMKTVLRLQ